jgi:hypothetical protein
MALGIVCATAGSCTAGPRPSQGAPERPSRVAARLDELRARDLMLPRGEVEAWSVDDLAIRPKTATVKLELPRRASGAARLGDDNGMAIAFSLAGAASVDGEVDRGYVLYPGALEGADVLHRPSSSGTEDYVVFESRPREESLSYDVELSGVAGLRLVANVLEFLDDAGDPKLRISGANVVDAGGAAHDATIALEGCAADTNAAAPWGRPIVRPGASRCRVGLSWHVERYPAIVDPMWTPTGTMSVGRYGHQATLLPSGDVLVAGGCCGAANAVHASAELFHPDSKTFATTGSMNTRRQGPAAAALPDGKVLVVGGVIGQTSSGSCEVYNPATGQFTACNGSVATGYLPTATLMPPYDTVLVTGGEVYGGTNVTSNVAAIYSPDANTLSALSVTMSVGRADHSAAWVPALGKVLVAGGYTYSGSSTAEHFSAELYDPATLKFEPAGTMRIARSQAAIVVLSSTRVLIAGGYNHPSAQPLGTTELWTSSGTTGAFVAGPTLNHARGGTAAVRLLNDQVVIGGGAGTIAEVLSPGASSFTDAAFPMSADRSRGTATLLKSGQVLFAGGYGAGAPSSAELFGVLAGGACTSAGDCVSDICEDGVCCAGPCSGTCKTCQAGSGVCIAMKGAEDPNTCAGTQSCDAAGACKKKNGQSCGAAGECASGSCVDGYCCNNACNGTCDACNQPGALGTCVVKAGPGSPACANNFACDGTASSCPTSCTSDVQCATTAYCAKNGTCQPRRAVGQSCESATDCKSGACRVCSSGNCVDGVCCDKPCDGACEACSSARKVSGTDGICGFAKGGTNPRGACVADANPNSCKADGFCDGNGNCRLHAPPTTPCGPTSCAGNTLTGKTCDGSGACVSGSTTCGLNKCVADTLGASCANVCMGDDADCVNGICEGAQPGIPGVCRPRRTNGAPCSQSQQCGSGNCVDGVCCDTSCQGRCEACNNPGSEGTCSSAPPGQPRGNRPACGGDPRCGGYCRGTERDCFYPGKELRCQDPTCSSTIESAVGACNGFGSCQVAATRCSGDFACDSSSGECKARCSVNADCAPNHYCNTHDMICVAGLPNGERCENTAQCSSSFCVQKVCCATPCEGGTCEGGTCKPAAPPHDVTQVNGCGAGPTPRESGGVVLGFGILASILLRRRRRAEG